MGTVRLLITIESLEKQIAELRARLEIAEKAALKAAGLLLSNSNLGSDDRKWATVVIECLGRIEEQ